MNSLTYEQQLHFAWQLVQLLNDNKTWAPSEYYDLIVWEMSLTDIVACLLATEEEKALALKRTLQYDKS